MADDRTIHEYVSTSVRHDQPRPMSPETQRAIAAVMGWKYIGATAPTDDPATTSSDLREPDSGGTFSGGGSYALRPGSMSDPHSLHYVAPDGRLYLPERARIVRTLHPKPLDVVELNPGEWIAPGGQPNTYLVVTMVKPRRWWRRLRPLRP